ncbi:MAG: UDP-N-acetylmuramoyl-L-alanyl-D-glutamate--2,6-diaminopimelate ligase [bacterium]
MKKFLKKLIPKFLIRRYHQSLSFLAASYYRHPSNDLIVIGVTGTNGKSTTSYYIAKLLEAAGYKVGLITTAMFKIAGKEWINNTKQTMPGRFRLQKLIRKMVRKKCEYAIIETSSEGITQYRACHIAYDIAVFTNLTPEHIEAHGSFENYKKAKGELFANLKKTPTKQVFDKTKFRPIPKTAIVNLADKEATYFLSFLADEKLGYLSATKESTVPTVAPTVMASNISSQENKTTFIAKAKNEKEKITLDVLGDFNVENALAALTCCLQQKISLADLKKYFKSIPHIIGRLERIASNKKFEVYVDYAHEPASLEKVYQTLQKKPHHKIISVLGAAGGGRDKGKRKTLGELAAKYTDFVIVTNEDPYDEDPEIIIDSVLAGAVNSEKKLEENAFKILDREEALKKALKLANENDIIIVTGKGSEQSMVVKNNKKIPWDDREKIKNLLSKI